MVSIPLGVRCRHLLSLEHLAMTICLKFKDLMVLVVNIYLNPQQAKEHIKSTWSTLEGYVDDLILESPVDGIIGKGSPGQISSHV